MGCRATCAAVHPQPPGAPVHFRPVVIPRPARVASAALLAGGVALLIGSGGASGVGATELHCIAAADSQALDAQLAAAGSPLAGNGAVFVREGMANGIDPRFLVAITAQETMLQTYGPAHEIHNAFGLGPGIVFPDEAAAITMAARTLGNYAADGLTTIRAISGRWAPVGASNDPRGLNAGWSDGVGTFFAALGGDPMLPVLTTAQNPAPTCAPAGSTAAPGASISASGIIPAVTPTDGPAMVTIWGGLVPAATGTALAQGGDPTSRRPAVIDGFAFPLAPPASAPVRYVDAASEPVVLTSAPGVTVVAPLAGRLRIASAADQRSGIGFWIVSTGGDRIGLGALAAYEDGLSEGVVVPAGQVLGHSNGSLAVAWRRGRVPVAIFPLLSATRPSD